MTTELCLLLVVGLVLGVLILGFVGAPFWAWTILAAVGLAAFQAPVWLWVVFAVIAIVGNIKPIRAVLLSSFVMKVIGKVLPQISETERVALKAGDVWVEAELFSGKPDFTRMIKEPYPQLTAEEQAFIDGPVEQICALVNDWEVYKNRELPKEVFDFLKKEKFWGMIIPKEYGGLGFSALAHSEVIHKLATRCVPLTVTVMVPNSLGPAELLVHYGTQAQKDHYLPRLARGEEIPCFALTEPNAGSDAGSIQATGVVFRDTDGQLKLQLNWNKRWITLAAISTTMGMAFRLKDPENFLGKGEDVGITCALIPTKTPGVVANRRHDPLSIPFFNCPTQGKDVVVGIDAIIGGPEMAGKGWQMLMESLAAGRGISLPAQSVGGIKYIAMASSSHATVRRQFGISIGKFEGVQEPLARMAGFAYLFEGARRYTIGAIDQGSKPPVITAMAKYYFTEASRQIVNDGMDVLGGAAISMGPHNLIATGYMAMPVSITVEGANILTRTLIIFGQGALRAHPWAYKEIDAVDSKDLRAFDRAFWGHAGHVIRNSFRSKLLFLTRGHLGSSPVSGVAARYWKKLSWASATFALLADIAMGGLGGKLKIREKITGRFADILGWMYLASATLRRFEAEGRRKEDEPFLHWSCQYAMAQIQKAFDGLYANIEIPLLRPLFAGPIRWMHALNPMGSMPSDNLDFKLADLIQQDTEQRDRLFSGVYIPKDGDQRLRQLEDAFRLSLKAEGTMSKVKRAVKKKQLQKKPAAELYRDAVAANIITQAEYETIDQAEKARWAAIQVDDFGLDEYLQRS